MTVWVLVVPPLDAKSPATSPVTPFRNAGCERGMLPERAGAVILRSDSVQFPAVRDSVRVTSSPLRGARPEFAVMTFRSAVPDVCAVKITVPSE